MSNIIKIFLAFLIDFSIASILFFINFDQINSSHYFKYFDHLLNSPQKIILIIYLLAQFIRLISVLIFSKSVGQNIWNLSSSGNFFERRLQGFIRTVFEVFTYFTLIFELPRLFNYKSLAEFISNSKIKFLKRKEATAEIITFLCFILIFLSPFFYRTSSFRPTILHFSSVKEFKLSNGIDFSKFKEINSNLFHFSTFTNGDNGRFIILPSFEILTKKKTKRLRPFVYLYDKNLETYGSLKIHKKISLHKFLKTFENLFDYHQFYSEIQKFLLQNENQYKKKNFVYLDKNKSFLSKSFLDDQLLLFYDIFNLSPFNAYHYLKTKKYNLFSYLYLRYQIYDLLNINHWTTRRIETDSIKLGNSEFIRIKGVASNDLNKKNIRELLLPLKTNHLLIMELKWPSTLDGAISNREFKKYYLTQSKWYFDYNNISKNLEKNNHSFQSFQFIDKLFKNNNTKKNTFNNLRSYVFYLNKIRSENIDNIVLNSLILKVVNRLLIYCEIKKINRKSFVVTKLKDLRINLK